MRLGVLILIAVMLGAGAFALYDYLRPDIIHGLTVCGQVLRKGKPVSGPGWALYATVGGRRHTLEAEKLADSGTEDSTSSLREISPDSAGRFCLDHTPLKYYYRLKQFKILSLQVGQSEAPVPPADPYAAKPPVTPPKHGVEGLVVGGSIDRKTQDLRLDAVFDLGGVPPGKTGGSIGTAYRMLFNNDQRLGRATP
jgi:hypothetical protein